MVRFDYDVDTIVNLRKDENLDTAQKLQKDTGLSSKDAKSAMAEEGKKRVGRMSEERLLNKRRITIFIRFLILGLFLYAWWKYR